MGLTAKKTGSSNFTPAPAGVHHAVCYMVVDLGTQVNELYGKEQHKAVILWELPHETIEIEDAVMPRVVSKIYTLSLHEKANLRLDLESWRGRGFTDEELDGFDITKLIGANCQLNIIHRKSKTNDNIYANISAVMPLPKGTTKMEPFNETILFSFEDHTPVPEGIPEWITGIIMQAKEYNEEGQGAGDPDGPMPGGYDEQSPPPLEEEVPF